jgi:uncharacterized membrane protein HdeD (DUF308 family)
MKTSIWTLLLGILMIAAGAYALINPFPASLAVTIFAGWSFIILGILQIISGFSDSTGGTRILLIILGIAMAWAGWVVLKNPIAGLLVLSMAVSISFIASGIAKLILGWLIRSGSFGIWIMLSGALSLVLGVLFLGNMVDTATWLLGFLLGIELISDGVAAIALWYHGKRA